MPPRVEEDDTGALGRARNELYSPGAHARTRPPLSAAAEHALPHGWEEKNLVQAAVHKPLFGSRHVRLASIFFGGSILFFLFAVAAAGYLFYSGGNSISTDKVQVDIQGPITVSGGDTVPLSVTITNTNPTEIKNAAIEIDFPSGTRNADNVLAPYPRYVEDLGTLASGAAVTRSIKAVVFGTVGQTVTLPVSLTYSIASSNAVFEKKLSYALSISSTPLSVSVDTIAETVSGEPFSIALTVRSNAIIPLSNIVLTSAFPFGFATTTSSLPLSNSNFFIGTLAPGGSKQVRLTGILTGQNNEKRVFHFSVGTTKSPQDQDLAVTYMTQDATVSVTAPFITTNLSLNGGTADNAVLAPGSTQNVMMTYSNTLPTPITNAAVTISVTGSAIDYNSIKTTNGFYNSINHTIVFSKDTNPGLAFLAPGASGSGGFTFSTVPAGIASPSVSFSISASGTRDGQASGLEKVTTSSVKTAKVATTVSLSAHSLHTSGPFTSSGPIPPRAEQATSYSIVWDVRNGGSAVADGKVTATLPGYVSYTGKTSGAGKFSYDSSSNTVTWNTGDLAQGGSAQGAFQVSLTPSTSQRGSAVSLTSMASFFGYDRFVGARVSSTAAPATTETPQDPGYVAANGIVQ
ncbi:MAG: hypothetical protein WAW90_01910 [Minisyncoccia bacterium]